MRRMIILSVFGAFIFGGCLCSQESLLPKQPEEFATKEQKSSPELKAKIKELIKKLYDDEMKQETIEAIIDIGTPAKAILNQAAQERKATDFCILVQRILKTIDEKEKIDKFIPQFGDNSYEVREKATQTLIEMRPGGLLKKSLQEAQKSLDSEIALRTKMILDSLTDPERFEYKRHAIKIHNQKFLLLKQGDKYGAIRFTASGHDGDDGWAEYKWYFQDDGSGDFTNKNVISGKSKVFEKYKRIPRKDSSGYTVIDQGGVLNIKCGDITTEWSSCSETHNWVYFHPRSLSKKYPEIEMAYTGLTDIRKIDASIFKWEWLKKTKQK